MVCACTTVGIGIAASVFPHVGMIVHGFRSHGEIEGWYSKLHHPSWSAPEWLYGPVWSGLYTGMGYASYMVWRDAGQTFGGAATLPLSLYAAQLALNWAWPEIVFKRHNLRLGLYMSVAMLPLISATAYTFYQVNENAGHIILAYLAWMTYGTVQMYRLCKANPKAVEGKKE